MTELKLVNIKHFDSEDIVTRLERLLNLAKEDRLHDFACVYFLDDEPSYTHSYRVTNRIRLIGHLTILLRHIMDFVVVE